MASETVEGLIKRIADKLDVTNTEARHLLDQAEGMLDKHFPGESSRDRAAVIAQVLDDLGPGNAKAVDLFTGVRLGAESALDERAEADAKKEEEIVAPRPHTQEGAGAYVLSGKEPPSPARGLERSGSHRPTEDTTGAAIGEGAGRQIARGATEGPGSRERMRRLQEERGRGHQQRLMTGLTAEGHIRNLGHLPAELAREVAFEIKTWDEAYSEFARSGGDATDHHPGFGVDGTGFDEDEIEIDELSENQLNLRQITGGRMFSAYDDAYGGVGDHSFIGQMNFMSGTDMITQFWDLPEDELIQLQHQLFEAGYYGEGVPTFGSHDQATLAALKMFHLEASQIYRDMSPAQVLKLKTEEASQGRAQDQNADLAELKEDMDVKMENMKAATAVVKDTVTAMAREGLGRNPTDAEMKASMGAWRQSEKEQFEQSSEYKDYMELSAQLGDGGGPSDMTQFMRALSGQESGGAVDVINKDSGARGMFQIMPYNWGIWAREAGVDPTDRSAESQWKVAKYKLNQYYALYGDYRQVAMAWYAGTGFAGKNLTVDQGGYPSIMDYGNEVMSRFNSLRGVDGADSTPDFWNEAGERTPNEEFMAQRELYAQNPLDFHSKQMANREEEYIGLLARGAGI